MSMEPRIVRTRHALTTALLRLLDDTQLEAITVTGLCREAGVHRTTFYGHHRDVVGFAASVFVDELDAIARVDIDAHTSLAAAAVSDAYAESLRQMLEHIARERTTYRALFAFPVGSGFRGSLTARIRDRVLAALAAWKLQGIATTLDDAAAAAYISGGIVGTLEHWAASDQTDSAAYALTINDLSPGWWPRPTAL